MVTKTVSKRAPKTTEMFVPNDEQSELEQLRARIAELESGKAPRRKKGPFDDIAQKAFDAAPHWDPRITRYYAASSPELRNMKRERQWTNSGDVTDYVVDGVHLRHAGAWEVDLSEGKKGVKGERQTLRIVEVVGK